MASQVIQSSGDLASSLERVGGRIIKSINDTMAKGMREVQEKAVAYVPVEEHNLEKSIKLSNENHRRKWVVFIDTSVPDNTGKYTVGDYANFIHEGRYKLGPASVAKDGGTGRVGPKFLERAFHKVIDDKFLAKLKDMAIEFGVKR